MKIRIVRRPIGEAPENIRDAWIGLTLPVSPIRPQAITARTFGVLSGPRSRLASRLRLFLGGGERVTGYPVDVAVAVEILRKVNASAADWWVVNAPHLFRDGRRFVFHEECCVAEE
jgi:hypothetical protein